MKALNGSAMRNWIVTSLVIVVIGILVLLYVPQLTLSTVSPSDSNSYPLPSFEGLHFIFVGLQPAGSSTLYTANANASEICPYGGCGFIQQVGDNGQITTTNNPNYGATSYSWSYDQTQSSIQMCNGDGTYCVSTKITASTVAPTQIGSLSYPVYFNGGYYEVSGLENQNIMQLDLAVQSGSSTSFQFKGDVFWFAVFSEGYNNVYPVGNVALPNGTLTATWATPLITEYTGAATPPPQAGSQANNYETTPGTATANAPITLYNQPQASSQFYSLIADPSGIASVPQILSSSNILAPDTRMQEFGFFKVTLNNFGSFYCGIFPLGGECDNNLLLNFYVDTLTLGRYIYTNPEISTQSTKTNNCEGTCLANPLMGISAWLSNPFNLAALASVLVVIVLVVVLVLVGPELLVGLAAVRKAKS